MGPVLPLPGKSARTAVLSSTGMLTSPNVSEPFQIAAIRTSSPEFLPGECMKANQMPPVENFLAGHGCKKAPHDGALLELMRKPSGGFRDVRGLRSLLTLDYFELDLVALSERFESRPTDRAEMDKDVRTTLA